MSILTHLSHEGNGVLALDTGMTPRSFAQSRIGANLYQEGWIIGPEGTLSSWKGEGTLCAQVESHRERMMIYGPDFAGRTLLEAITDESPQRAWEILQGAASLLVKTGSHTPEILEAVSLMGPGGVLVRDDGALLVLPRDIYLKCLGDNGEKTETALRTLWVHPDPARSGKERAFAFLAGTLAYRIIAGVPPFSQSGTDGSAPEQINRSMRKGIKENLEDRVWNLRQGVALCVNSLIDARLAASIDTFIAFGSDWANVRDPAKEGMPESPEFVAKRQKTERARINKAKRESLFRMNKPLFTGIALALAFLGVLYSIWLDGKNRGPSTAGLDSGEVVQRFYAQGIGTPQDDLIRAYLARGTKNDYEEFATYMYVTGKTMNSYDTDAGLLSPEKFLAQGATGKQLVYGITQLKTKLIQVGEKTAEYDVSFYYWLPIVQNPDSPEKTIGINLPLQLSLYRYEDRVTLSKKGNRWLISAIDQRKRETIYNQSAPILEAIASGKVKEAPWAP